MGQDIRRGFNYIFYVPMFMHLQDNNAGILAYMGNKYEAAVIFASRLDGT